MTFVVTDNCIKCRYRDCVEVCPVDYKGENILAIHSDECIDGGVCGPSAGPNPSSPIPSPVWRNGLSRVPTDAGEGQFR